MIEGTRRMRERRMLCRYLPLAALWLCSATAHADDARHEMLLFPSIDTYVNFDLSDESLDDQFIRPSINGLYSYSGGRFRILGEYLLSSEESELERLKLGWQFTDATRIWLGRFHTTSKFWTTEFHHGQFMQTSITRPSIEAWEDESGPIPSHITGVSLDHDISLARASSLGIAASVGFAPRFVGDELRPFDILDPDSDHGMAVNLRVAYKPDMFGGNQLGFVFGQHHINVDPESDPGMDALDKIDLHTLGVFGDWSWGDWRILGSLVHFQNQLYLDTGRIKDEFRSGYVQVEFGFSENWTAFARTDNSFTEDNSPYLRMLPEYLAHRHMLGLRWDFARNNSVTVEIADTSAQGDSNDHDAFKEMRLQWSAVYP